MRGLVPLGLNRPHPLEICILARGTAIWDLIGPLLHERKSFRSRLSWKWAAERSSGAISQAAWRARWTLRKCKSLDREDMSPCHYDGSAYHGQRAGRERQTATTHPREKYAIWAGVLAVREPGTPSVAHYSTNAQNGCSRGGGGEEGGRKASLQPTQSGETMHAKAILIVGGGK